MLSFKYLQTPIILAPCGSAADRIRWELSGTIPQGVHAIVQMVTRESDIERSTGPPVRQTETFFELWDVTAIRQNQIAIMGNGQDEFAGHDQAGAGTKGSWLIEGVARLLLDFDVLDAMNQGEPWQRGVIPGTGNWLYTLRQTPTAWDQSSGEVARRLSASWSCFPNEAQQPTDLAGSGLVSP
jgi:hypothetical protein